MSRPDRLPRSATRVIEWSRVLPPGVKLVWLKSFWLDQGPEGAFVSAPKLANMLGMQPDTADKYRRFLVRVGLLVTGVRKGPRGSSWFPVLPPDCTPSPRANQTEIDRCGEALDKYVRRAQTPDARPGQDPDQRPDIRKGESRMLVRDSGSAVGGKGGAPRQLVGTHVPSSSGDTDGGETRRVATPPDNDEEYRARTAQEERLMKRWLERRQVRS